jgi:LmbE family N-acetylglucosaminyl deacetylase
MVFNKNSRIMVVVAHPDDETLGCGGTIIKAREAGARVAVLFLGEGVSARFTPNEYETEAFKEQTTIRQNGAKNALKILGIDNLEFGDRLCTQFDTYPLLDFVKTIERHIAVFKPNIIFTHGESEVNIDHKITHKAVEVACRPIGEVNKIAVYSIEIICSGSFKFNDVFKPNVYVDVEQYWNQKMKAWRCYAGESREFPFPRSEEGLKVLANYRGIQSGTKLAEGFKLERMLLT